MFIDKKNFIILSPIITLVLILCCNMMFFENPIKGPNQIALITAALIGSIIAHKKKVSLKDLTTGIYDSIKSSLNAIVILLIIGGLTSSWILSGIVPAMIYYGIELINPQFFLLTSCIICAIVSLATGSSWTTAATVGVALIGIGNLLSINIGLVAGAIISGAYFGDKMSPLSETTNLAPSVSGSDLISHIRYMTYTTIPSIIITLLLFFFIGLKTESTLVSLDEIDIFLSAIDNNFFIGFELFLIPALIIVLIYKKVSAIKTLLVGLITGAIFAYIFQMELITQIIINSNNDWTATNTSIIETIIKNIFLGTEIDLYNTEINKLLEKGGVFGMLWIVLLVLSAMVFGGVMYAGGFLKAITNQLISRSSSNIKLIGSTAGSCMFFNITTCDQYLAIVVPGRMFKEIYKDHKLDPCNLSRTIEDSGTVTSVLIPWNTCAIYHTATLGVNPLLYVPFCFFNIISPFMTLFFSYMEIKVKKLNHDKEE
tara:strand:+ start:21791 stop:23245 length:1455 start_codon:yes stop_codon:yes gene_type:complete